MNKTVKTTQRGIVKASTKKQKTKPVPNRAVSMKHTIKKPGGKA